MAATCRCPSGQTTFSPRHTHFRPPACSYWRHSGGITTSPSPQIRRKSTTLTKERAKERRKNRASVWSPPSLLLRPLGSGLDLHPNLRVHLLSHLLLGGRGLVLGYLGSLGPFLPAWAGGGLPPPRKLAGLLLGGAGLGPRPMRSPAVGALGSHMRAPVASSRPASLNGTLVVVCGVVLSTDGTPGGL